MSAKSQMGTLNRESKNLVVSIERFRPRTLPPPPTETAAEITQRDLENFLAMRSALRKQKIVYRELARKIRRQLAVRVPVEEGNRTCYLMPYQSRGADLTRLLVE